jgi:hypothetical protein
MAAPALGSAAAGAGGVLGAVGGQRTPARYSVALTWHQVWLKALSWSLGVP